MKNPSGHNRSTAKSVTMQAGRGCKVCASRAECEGRAHTHTNWHYLKKWQLVMVSSKVSSNCLCRWGERVENVVASYTEWMGQQKSNEWENGKNHSQSGWEKWLTSFSMIQSHTVQLVLLLCIFVAVQWPLSKTAKVCVSNWFIDD